MKGLKYLAFSKTNGDTDLSAKQIKRLTETVKCAG